MNRLLFHFIFYFVLLFAPLQLLAGEAVNVGEIIEKCIASYAKVNDYSCLLHRKDMVNSVLKEHTTVLFKFKKPAHYYMKWEKDKIEALYVEGKYNDKMVIHGGFLFKFISIAVNTDAALKYNRHTIREADIGHILNIFETNYHKASTDKGATIKFEKDEMLNDRNTWLFKAVFPEGKDYYGHIVFVNIDKTLFLPIKIVVYGWNMELLEQYYYEDLKVNVGLTEEDFDINNKEYLFKLGY